LLLEYIFVFWLRTSFMNVLLDWYEKNKRILPWRNSDDPYKILLSEFILQQTRVNQGLKYYYTFLDNFPTIFDLASADFDEIMRLWQGLGYYSRAKNLWLTCREIVFNQNGVFPDNFIDLKKLKGVGDYTAAAVASFAFNEPVPAIDGNVYRVLSRYFAEATPIDSSKGKKVFWELAMELLDSKTPGLHNQAIMELGATLCTPTNPECASCPFVNKCIAFIKGNFSDFPVKTAKTNQRKRYFYFYFFDYKGTTFLQKRIAKDIWNGLYQFPMIESESPLPDEEYLKLSDFFESKGTALYNILKVSDPIKHILSHQILIARFIHVNLSEKVNPGLQNTISVPMDQLDKYALPRLITRYLEGLDV
jgi:A/G-specific adenine glycosylase